MSRARKIWHFIWEDNSPLSWAVNVVLAFVIIKFLVYPGLGFVLDTPNPVVAVVSCSMEHRATNCGEPHPVQICGNAQDKAQFYSFDEYWELCGDWYEERAITQSDFKSFPLSNGFNKGDLMILRGKDPEDVEVGDVVVFQGGQAEPIIHRVVWTENTGNSYIYSTKGDQNADQLLSEKRISSSQVIGTAAVRIPLLGYVKILFTSAVSLFV